MTIVANRYADLLSQVPAGDFYNSQGLVLPFRSDPYKLRLTTTSPTTVHGIFINAKFVGEVITDVNGVALVTVLLNKGDNAIDLVNRISHARLSTYITTRDYATWLAGLADVIEPMDADIETILANRDLATVNFDKIDEIWGRRLHSKNSPSYPLETYRELLQDLHQAYRRHGSTVSGVMEAVGAYTLIHPLVYGRDFGPRWMLGADLLRYSTVLGSNGLNNSVGKLHDNYRNISAPLTNINFGAPGNVIIQSFNLNGAAAPATGTLTKQAGPGGPLSWFDGVNTSALVSVPSFGSATIKLTAVTGKAIIRTLPGPFTVTAGDQIAIELDGKGILIITLPASPISAAQLVTAVNTALSSDTRYGAGYATAAAVDGTRVKISNQSRLGIGVRIHPITGQDASTIIFGLPWSFTHTVGSTLTSAVVPFTVTVTSVAAFPKLDVENTWYATFDRVRAGAVPLVFEVKSVNVGGNQITCYPNPAYGVSTFTIPNSASVEVTGQLPYETLEPTDESVVTVFIQSCGSLPIGLTNDNVSIKGSTIPDGWWITGLAAPTDITTRQVATGFFHETSLVVTNVNPTGWGLTTQLKPYVLDYKGYSINYGFWVSREPPDETGSVTISAEISFDGGSTWAGSSISLGGGTNQVPVRVGSSTLIPSTATDVWIRLRLNNGTAANTKIRVEQAHARLASHTALSLGTNTTPRNQHRAKRGYFMFIWSNEQLSSDENTLIGLPQGTIGHVDTVAPAHVALERFDVSEYSGNVPQNVIGAFTDVDWLAGTITNMDLVLRSPSRFSYLKPSLISSVVGESVISTVAPPYKFALSKTCDQDLSLVTLYENGIPVTHDQLSFADNTHLQVSFTPDTTKTYTVDYNTLIQFESAVLQVPGTVTDRTWFADCYTHLAMDMTPLAILISTGIQFGPNFKAKLRERSDRDQSVATLIADNGVVQTIVDQSSWRFADAATVSIDSTVFDPNSLYTLTYNARPLHPKSRASVKLELRQGANAGAVTAASYQQVTINQVVQPQAYFQMRATITGVKNVNDVRLQSVLLKGLNISGVAGTVPVLRNRVWTPISH